MNSYELAQKCKGMQKLVGKSVRIKWNKPPEEKWNKKALDDVGIIKRVFIQEEVEINGQIQNAAILFGVNFEGYSRVASFDNIEVIE